MARRAAAMSPQPARAANAALRRPWALSTRNEMPIRRVALTRTSTRSGIASIHARRRLGTRPAATVAARSVRMMNWGPGNGSRSRKPVAPALRARPSQMATATAAAPGNRGAGMGEAVIGTLQAEWHDTGGYTTIGEERGLPKSHGITGFLGPRSAPRPSPRLFCRPIPYTRCRHVLVVCRRPVGTDERDHLLREQLHLLELRAELQ